MQILENIEEFTPLREPLVLTIGNFDGMHRGHAALLKKVKDLTGPEGQSIVLTFRNHPSEILQPDKPACLLCALPHKLRLLQGFKIDHIILLTFSPLLAKQNAASFIERIRQSIPFTHLVLGHDATLGRDKQGDRAVMLELADLWGFTIYYLDEFRYEGKGVSSSRIREALQQGDLHLVETLLNRPYSIYAPVIPQNIEENRRHAKILLDVSGLCLPPIGSYAVQVLKEEVRLEGTATLTPSPASSTNGKILFEVQLQEKDQKIEDSSLEVVFLSSHFDFSK